MAAESRAKKGTERLSVCIVAYRDEEDVLRALETLEQYTDPGITKTVYVVDNSGEGESRQAAFQEKIESFPDAVYRRTEENIGYGRGQNTVLEELHSEYHCIMNPDIVFCQDAFSGILAYMDKNPAVGMVIPQILDENGKRQPVYRKEPTVLDMFIRMFCREFFPNREAEHSLQHEDYTKPFHVPFGQGSFLVIRTELFRELGGFDGRFFLYMEDADLCRRVNREAELQYLPDAAVIHHWKRGSHRNLNLFRIHLRSMKAYFDKWGWKWH